MKPRHDLLPYGRQTIDEDDIACVSAALRRDFLTTGPLVEVFEAKFCEVTGARHAVACNSGTAALHLAVLAHGLRAGDAAVVPTLTFLATANAVRFTGAEVVFADVDCERGLMTPDLFSRALEQAHAKGLCVKVALPVHLSGQVCDMARLHEVARDRGIALVEDACHALGVKDIGATRNSSAACFSTHAVKAITTGEGGVVTTADAAAAERMRRLRNHGAARAPHFFTQRDLAFDDGAPNPWYYEMQELGWNYRLPDVLCALGISQLDKLDQFWRRRQALASLYDEALAPLGPVVRPVPHDGAAHGWHLYQVLIDFRALGTTRRRVMEELRAAGIGSQVHYLPVHQQQYYRLRYGELRFPGAEAYYARCLSLPLFPSMSDSDVRRAADALARAAHRAAA
jgi:UDP-4-amino-4,6-dideoxy-N-acetyl-beta-L-altrosamine transaminase